jgi:hypothetical protein
LLAVAAAVSIAVGERTSGAIILAIIGLSVGLGLFNEYRSEQTLASLRSRTGRRATVLRDGGAISALLTPPNPADGELPAARLEGTAPVDLFWLPLGAGGHCVRLNGRVYETLAAWRGRRPRRDIYHSALVIAVPEARFVIEMAPIRDGHGGERGVVAEGAVGSRAARRFQLFRYEIRRWRDGVIPDVAEAVDSPQRLSDDPAQARRLLELVPEVPTPVWGRDEFGAGEMWNSNSLISWLLARGGLDVDAIRPPPGGRAPGWQAGLVAARRQGAQAEGANALSPPQALLESYLERNDLYV